MKNKSVLYSSKTLSYQVCGYNWAANINKYVFSYKYLIDSVAKIIKKADWPNFLRKQLVKGKWEFAVQLLKSRKSCIYKKEHSSTFFVEYIPWNAGRTRGDFDRPIKIDKLYLLSNNTAYCLKATNRESVNLSPDHRSTYCSLKICGWDAGAISLWKITRPRDREDWKWQPRTQGVQTSRRLRCAESKIKDPGDEVVKMTPKMHWTCSNGFWLIVFPWPPSPNSPWIFSSFMWISPHSSIFLCFEGLSPGTPGFWPHKTRQKSSGSCVGLRPLLSTKRLIE